MVPDNFVDVTTLIDDPFVRMENSLKRAFVFSFQSIELHKELRRICLQAGNEFCRLRSRNFLNSRFRAPFKSFNGKKKTLID
jgi:hypothetical protein